MSTQCLPPRGQLFHFAPTNGPLLLLGEGQLTRRQCLNRCAPPCVGPRVPQGTVVFFPPKKVAPPYRPPMPPVPVIPVPPPSFGNIEQTCIDECPPGTEGDPISVTIPADNFFRPTLEEANAAALAEACEQAAALRLETPCVGAPIEPTVMEFASRERDGEAELCGFSEYDGLHSCPPKKYLNFTPSGNAAWDYYPSANPPPAADCPDVFSVQRGFGSVGNWSYDPSTCTKTGSGSITNWTESGTSAPIPVNEAAFGYPAGCSGATCGVTCLTLSDRVVLGLENATCCGAYFPAGRFKYYLYSFLNDLTVEDTEQDAIDRAASALTPWGSIAWVPCGALPCGLASQTQRTCTGNQTDFQLAFQQSQFQIHAEGFTAFQSYVMQVSVWRRNLDTLEEELMEILSFAPEADASGHIDAELDIPMEAGYETYVQDVEFFDS